MKNRILIFYMATLALLIFAPVGLAQDSADEVYGMSDSELLPQADGAWVIHLFTSGGLTGRGLPAVTAISDGSFACGDIVPSNFRRLSDLQLKALSDAVMPAVLKPDKTMKPSDPSSDPVCNDCYFASVVLTRRETGGKVRTYKETEKLRRYPSIVETFAKLKEAVKKLDLCPK